MLSIQVVAPKDIHIVRCYAHGFFTFGYDLLIQHLPILRRPITGTHIVYMCSAYEKHEMAPADVDTFERTQSMAPADVGIVFHSSA